MMVSHIPTTGLSNELAETHSWRCEELPRALILVHLQCQPFVPHLRGALPPTVRQRDTLSPEPASPHSIRKSHAADPVQYRSTATSSLYHPQWRKFELERFPISIENDVHRYSFVFQFPADGNAVRERRPVRLIEFHTVPSGFFLAENLA